MRNTQDEFASFCSTINLNLIAQKYLIILCIYISVSVNAFQLRKEKKRDI